MAYFRNFPLVNYNFGNEINSSVFQNLTAYVDVVDQVKDDLQFYQRYYIKDNERPDVLSYDLYGTVDYYWMFYLLNDRIKQQGWPLTESELFTKSKDYYPHTVFFTTRSMHGEAFVGDYVATNTGAGFVNPDFKGLIIEKQFDLGQLVVKPTKEVRSITITNSGSGYTTIPTVTISGGSGSGAKAAAVIDTDATSPTFKQVTAITVTEGGDDFTAVPTVTISDPNEASGTTAKATAVVSTNTITIPLNGTVTLYSKRNDANVNTWNLSDVEPLQVHGQAEQWDSAHHYEDVNGNHADLTFITDTQFGVNNKEGSILVGSDTFFGYNDVDAPVDSNKTRISYLDNLRRENDLLRNIKVFTPQVANNINAEVQRLLKT